MTDKNQGKNGDGERLLYCSFCGKSQHEVRKLIAGPSVFICDECVALCNDIIEEEALEKTDLQNLAQTPGRFLSAGQKKRVSLARLLTSGAPLWFLDEPTVTLDSESEKILENLILKHRSCEGIVVVATHSKFKIDQAHKLNMGSHIISGSNLTQGKLTSYQDKNSEEIWQEW